MKVASVETGLNTIVPGQCGRVGELRQVLSAKENTSYDGIVMFNGDRLVTPIHDTLQLTNYKNAWLYKKGHYVNITNVLTNSTHSEYYAHNAQVNVNHLISRYNGKYKTSHLCLVYKGVTYGGTDQGTILTIDSNDSITLKLHPDYTVVSGTIELGPDEYTFKDTVFGCDTPLSRVFDDVGRIYFTVLGHDCRYNVNFFKFKVNEITKSADDVVGFGTNIQMKFEVPQGYCCVQSTEKMTYMVTDSDICDHSFFVIAGTDINLKGKRYSDFAVNRHLQIEIVSAKENDETATVEICVKMITGRSRIYRVNTSYIVYLVKLLIQNSDGISPVEQRLIYGGKTMENHHTLGQHGISSGTTLHLVLRLRGGGCGEFVDLTKTDKRTKSDWAKTAPPWRRATQGLGLMGRCTNWRCQAHTEYVLYNHGVRAFTLSTQPKCPMCEKKIYVRELTLNNCCWRFEGIKMEDPTVLIQTEWESIGDHIIRYDKHLTGTSVWNFLQVEVRKNAEGKSFRIEKCPDIIVLNTNYVDNEYNKKVDEYFEKNAVVLPDITFCTICLSHSTPNDKLTRLECSHIFHSKCAAEWLKQSKRCPCCNNWSFITGDLCLQPRT